MIEFNILIGVSATGKSTHINNVLGGVEKNYIISDDEISEEMANELKISYEETFLEPKEEEVGERNKKYGEVIKITEEERKKTPFKTRKVYKKLYAAKLEERRRFFNKIKKAVEKGDKNIVIDSTNLTKENRKELISSLKDIKIKRKLKIVYKVFLYGDIETVIGISKIRHQKHLKNGESKCIEPFVYHYMDKIYEIPEREELESHIKEELCNNKNIYCDFEVIDNSNILEAIFEKERYLISEEFMESIEEETKKEEELYLVGIEETKKKQKRTSKKTKKQN